MPSGGSYTSPGPRAGRAGRAGAGAVREQHGQARRASAGLFFFFLFSFFFFSFFFLFRLFLSFPGVESSACFSALALLAMDGGDGDGWSGTACVAMPRAVSQAPRSASQMRVHGLGDVLVGYRAALYGTLRHSAALCDGYIRGCCCCSTLRRLHTWLLLLQHSAGRGCCGAVLLRAHAP